MSSNNFISNVNINGTLYQLKDPNNVQADWAQNDETKLDFLKNKPFGDIVKSFGIASSDVVFLPPPRIA